MITSAELAADCGQRLSGELAGEIHGDLARPRDARAARGGEQLLAGETRSDRSGGLDLGDGAGALSETVASG